MHIARNKKETALISVIIRTFNRAYVVEKAIFSVINQSYTNWEIIIVDNYSSDKTEEKLNEILLNPKIKFFSYKNNGVVSSSLNYGISHAVGDYIAILDSDDWWHKDKLKYSVQALNNGADVVYHNLFIHREKNKYYRKLIQKKSVETWSLKNNQFYDLLFRGNALANSSVIFRKNIVKKIGLFNEEYALRGDSDFEYWLRIAKHGYKFFRLKQTLGFYIISNNNLTSYEDSIASTKYIHNIYRCYINKNKTNYPSWIYYKLARSYFGLSDYRKAYRLSLLLIKNPIYSLKYLDKIIFIITISIFRLNFRKLFNKKQ